LPYKNDADGNPTLKREFVKNSNYLSDFGILVDERYLLDKFPKVSSREYLQFNNLYNIGFFDGYFGRQYKLLKDLYTARPDNFPKPIALIVDDSNRRVGYLTTSFGSNEVRAYIPRSVSLEDYLSNYKHWDEKLISEKMGSVTSLQDLIPENELNNFILKKGIKKLANGEKYLKEYKARIDVYKARMEELNEIKNQINDIVNYVNKNGLSHNNLYLENIVIYWDGNKEVKVGFINPINKQDIRSQFFSSDKHRVKLINHSISWAEFKTKVLINKYVEKYRSIYPGFKIK